MPSIFSKIISGDIPSHKIAETDKFLAFLDINPLAEGHTLVIPKQEIDYVFEVPDDLLAELMVFAKKVAIGIERAIPCERIGLSIIGLEVPHTHIHLIPINAVGDMNFAKPKLQFTNEDLASIADKIKKEI